MYYDIYINNDNNFKNIIKANYLELYNLLSYDNDGLPYEKWDDKNIDQWKCDTRDFIETIKLYGIDMKYRKT